MELTSEDIVGWIIIDLALEFPIALVQFVVVGHTDVKGKHCKTKTTISVFQQLFLY